MTTVAQTGLICLLSAFFIFHFLVLLKIIPYKIVWGGRLDSDKAMYRFETASIIINTLFLLVVLAQAQILAVALPKIYLTVALWIMAALFSLNTLGNIFSKNKLEKKLFTPITFLMAVLSMVLALEN